MNLKTLVHKWRSLILFAFCGGFATILEVLIYSVLYEELEMPNMLATFISWFLSTLSCFYTNKYWVYGEKDRSFGKVMKEIGAFFLVRSSTGILNLVAMYVLVDMLDLWPILMKILVAFFLGFLNYFFGKIAVFRKTIE